MLTMEVISLLSSPGGTPADRAGEDLRLLRDRLEATGRGWTHVLSLTFFIDATEEAVYRRAKEDLLSLVRDVFSPDLPPPANVVAQPPEQQRPVALEATVLASPSADLDVSRETCEGLSTTVVSGRGVRQLHGGGASSEAEGDDTAAQAKAAFSRVEAALDREGMAFGNIVRQWNYIAGMLDVRNGCQRYQAFNDVRTIEYGRSRFPAGYPASTGIGQAAGGVVVEFIALEAPPDLRVVPLSNPLQIDAHRYSGGVLVGEPIEGLLGTTSPKFERAKLVARDGEEVVFVSGTAAIVGEKSVAPGDVRAQTRKTIDNIVELVGGEGLSHLRAYVKRAEDIPAVREVCEAAFGPIPALYVRADICRDELLVELEGELVRRPPGPIPLDGAAVTVENGGEGGAQ